MTLGTKLAKLRKEKNYTQEQLAEILGVSRQSISKWESDVAYPETEKLIRLGQLYGCTMDYLLNDQIEGPEKPAAPEPRTLRSFFFERASSRSINGLPLWHINFGLGRTAKGVFAIGLCAKGIVSLGVFSVGLLSFGCFSLGLLALGAFALGVIAVGSVSAGVIALGAISCGILALGALAVGEFSFGALSIGRYLAVGDEARAAIAIGKTEAYGTLYQAASITAENRQVIQDLLDQSVPGVLAWLRDLIKLFL